MRIVLLVVALAVWCLFQWAWGNFAYGALWTILERRYGWKEEQLRNLFLKYVPPLVPPLIIIIFAGFSFGWWAQLLDANGPKQEQQPAIPTVAAITQEVAKPAASAASEQSASPESVQAEKPKKDSIRIGKPKATESPAIAITGDCNQVANGDHNEQKLDCSKHYAGSPKMSNGLYQNGIQVGNAEGGQEASQDGNKITFQVLHFSTYVDAAGPIELGDLKLMCPDAPVRDPNRLVGSMSKTIAGATCAVVSRGGN